MSNFERCVIATRESPLAMWQALHIQSVLRARYPSASVELLGMTTRGDQILDRTLSKVGGKGLFVKELEVAMEAGEADLAVHSLDGASRGLRPRRRERTRGSARRLRLPEVREP